MASEAQTANTARAIIHKDTIVTLFIVTLQSSSNYSTVNTAIGRSPFGRIDVFSDHHLLIPRLMSDTSAKRLSFFLKKGPPEAVRLFLSFNYKGDEFKNK